MSSVITQIDRKTYIGGSDAATICGLNPWKTRFQLWLEKTGQSEPDDLSENERVYWGNVLEEVVATEWSVRTGQKIRRCNRMLTHDIYTFIGAHIDRDIPNTTGILECKTTGINKAADWGPSGTDQIPGYYLPQVQHYMAVTGAGWCAVAVLIGGQEFKHYVVQRDEEFITALIKLEVEFWELVESKTEPNPETAEEVRLRFPTSNANVIEATNDLFQTASELLKIKTEIDRLESEKENLEGILMNALGKNEVLTFKGQKIASWKSQTSNRWDTKLLESEHPELADQYKRPSESRPFRLSYKGGA